MFQSMLQDLRFAFRMLIKNPGFSVVAILTLALGLGANAAIFSVFNAVVLRPLPYRAPDRLVTLWGKIPGNGLEKLSASVPEFGDYRAQTNIFSLLAAYSSIGVNVTGGSEPQRVRGTFATADIFPLLGVTPLLGRPFLPEEDKPGSDDVVVQGQVSPTALIPAVRTTVLNLDADLPVYNVTSVEQLVTDSTTLRRFNAVLPAVFGTVALILAVVGLYGVLSFFVTQRIREIGIRLALGASKQNVFQLVIGQGMMPALAGIAGGLVCAGGVARLMEKLLFQISPTDWLTFVSVPMVLLGAVILAAWLPARRATEVEPMVALRCD